MNLKGEENHILPLLCSFVVPGGGQFYNGHYIKGAVYASIEAGMLYGALIQDSRYRQARDEMSVFTGSSNSLEYRRIDHEIRFYRKERDSFIWLTAAAVLLSAGDAFVDSYFKDFQRDKFAGVEIYPGISGITLVYSF